MRVWREGRVKRVERIVDTAEADARVLDHLAGLGCDPSQPRECRHYVYVSDEPGARAVAHAMHGDGWDAECEQLDGAWLVMGTVFTRLTDEVVRTTRARLELLAVDNGGEYDGWEAAAD